MAQINPSFLQELPPAVEKTPLLYHLSYLCLANFPNLENIIRSQAVETQMLFGCGDATMLKCMYTGKNLVESLFPMLRIAVEKDLPNLAVKHLNKAQLWIQDIIHDVDNTVEKYELHNKDVASSTSDVIKEKAEREIKFSEQKQELKQAEDTLNKLNSELQNTTAELDQTEQKIHSKTQEIQELNNLIYQTDKKLKLFAEIVPFLWPNSLHYPKNDAKFKSLEAELNDLIVKKTNLKQKQWELQLQITDWQMKSAKDNSIPDPIHLEEVRRSLTRIQEMLIELKNLWECVSKLLKYLEQKTFVGGHLLENLSQLKDVYIFTIQAAEKAWSSFGESCERASVIFRQQTKDAFKFLEVSPSSLSKEQWQEEYERVKARLEKVL